MSYIDYEYYTTKYGEIDEGVFDRILFEAERKVDIITTGIDGIRKLRDAFPTDKVDGEIVKRCICKVIDTINQIQKAEKAANEKNALTDGHYNLVSSISSGSESVSYATSISTATAIDEVLSDKSAQNRMIDDIIVEYLTGVTDSNGVYLLYMGEYPQAVSGDV